MRVGPWRDSCRKRWLEGSRVTLDELIKPAGDGDPT
jgi:hypothetical protein